MTLLLDDTVFAEGVVDLFYMFIIYILFKLHILLLTQITVLYQVTFLAE